MYFAYIFIAIYMKTHITEKNSIAERTIFWSLESENIIIRPMLADGSQKYTSIGVATILVFLNVILLHEGYKFVDMTKDMAIRCIAIMLFIYLHFFTYSYIYIYIILHTLRKKILRSKEMYLIDSISLYQITRYPIQLNIF